MQRLMMKQSHEPSTGVSIIVVLVGLQGIVFVLYSFFSLVSLIASPASLDMDDSTFVITLLRTILGGMLLLSGIVSLLLAWRAQRR